MTCRVAAGRNSSTNRESGTCARGNFSSGVASRWHCRPAGRRPGGRLRRLRADRHAGEFRGLGAAADLGFAAEQFRALDGKDAKDDREIRQDLPAALRAQARRAALDRSGDHAQLRRGPAQPGLSHHQPRPRAGKRDLRHHDPGRRRVLGACLAVQRRRAAYPGASGDTVSSRPSPRP